MHVTNNKGLPDAFVRAVTNDKRPYQPDGSYSITRLLAPPYQRKLQNENRDQITEDVSDRVWALFGQVGHNILERAAGVNDIVEERVVAEVGGHRVSGILDHLGKLDNVLSDYKVTSVWGVKAALRGEKEDFEKQLNILKYLRDTGNNVRQLPAINKLQVVAISRDWVPSKQHEPDYPDKVEVIPVAIWPREKVEALLKERLQLHTQKNPPPCTDEERWAKPGKVAVMKTGRKSALRLLESQEDAWQWMDTKGYVEGKGGIYLEKREAKYTRCETYCNVSHICPVWQEHLQNKAEAM